jgi:tRNA nucleotidyltransferase (CCA-adding enzyme)
VHHDGGEHLLRMLDLAARLDAPLTVRYGCLGHAIGTAATAGQDAGHDAGAARQAVQAGVEQLRGMSQRLRVPTALRELAELAAREQAEVHASASHDAATVLRLLQRCDAWRRPDRFGELLVVCECAARAQHGQSEQVYLQRQRLSQALQAAQAVDASAVVARARQQGQTGPALARALDLAREQALCDAGWPAAPGGTGSGDSLNGAAATSVKVLATTA